ncbi:MAG: ATP-binding protein [Defluviitaleaceae bacterium]|nr:ATP-binding protein [Defluviitaleaceae bacterium]
MLRIFAISIHLSALLTMAIMVYIFLTRLKSTKREFLVLFTFSGFLYALGALFEIMATTADGALFGLRLVALGMLLAPTFLYFLQQYCDRHLPKSLNFIIFSSTFLLIILLWTSPWHGLMYSSVFMLPEHSIYYSIYRWDITRGVLFPLTVIHPIICVMCSLMILIRKARSNSLQKKKLRTLIFCTAFPIIPQVIVLFNINIPDVHFVALFLAIANVVIYRELYKYDLLDNENELEVNEINELLLKASPFIMNIWDESINLISTSTQSIKMFELESQDQYLERFGELSPEYQPCGTPSHEKAVNYVKQAFRDGYIQFEWLHQNLNRELIPTEITIVRFTRQGKNFAAAYTVDLRPIKVSAEKVRELENKLLETEVNERIRLMLDSTPLLIEYWDENFNPVDCNKTTYIYYGFSTKEEYKEKLVKSTSDFIYDDTPIWNVWNNHLLEIFETGYSQFEITEKKPDGSIVNLEVDGVRMKYNDELVAVTYSKDITQLKQAHESLSHRERMLNTVNHVAESLLDVDNAGELENAILQSMAMIGLCLDADRVNLMLVNADEEGIKLTLDSRWHSEFGGKIQQMNLSQKIPWGVLPVCEELIFGGKSFNGSLVDFPPNERFALDPSGALKSVVIIPIFYQDQLWGIFSIDNCIHERILTDEEMNILHSASLMLASAYRRVEQEAEMYRIEIAEESNRAKSRFLARMSHEIRTPITAVMGISEIQLQNSGLPPQIEEAFAKIHNSANLLLGIINDILDHSKIEASKMEIAEEQYEVASLISDVAQLYLIYLDDKDIAFRISVDEYLPVSLIGDVLRIEQIISNLLSNAFKYTISGTVELSLQSQKDEIKDDYITIVITIRDTGLGMTPEQLKNLFTEYERFHMGEVSSATGTGLGMSIVQGLIQMMGAKIDIESEVGEGTTVTVRISQKIAGNEILGKEMANNLQQFEEYTRATAKQFKFVPEPMPYGKVLVVDDVEANLYVVKGLLAFYDLNVETCDNGQQAIEKVKQGKIYDIIFMDHMMPGLDGIETMHIMRNMGYTQSIVALTANALVGQAENFIESGFDGFISKPIQTKRLNTILMKHIRDKQPPEVIEAAKSAKRGTMPNQGGIDDYLKGADLREKLLSDFVKSHKKSFLNMNQAINTNDTKTAHRLAHTLKGAAGLLNESPLAQAAEHVEQVLANGKIPSTSQLSALEHELKCVLETINKLETATVSVKKDFNKVETIVLLDKLYPSLKSHNIECLSFIEELRAIPEATVLVRQIEDFDFTLALQTLDTLRSIWEE